MYKIIKPVTQPTILDINTNPVKYLFVCPKCGSSVNLLYALKLIHTTNEDFTKYLVIIPLTSPYQGGCEKCSP